MRDYRDSKAMAQTLRECLAAKNITLSHGESLELVSRILGVADWNTLSATLQAERAAPPPQANDLVEPAEHGDEKTRMLADQLRPRKAVPFEPRLFDRYVGYYEVGPGMICKVWRDGDKFISQLTGQIPVEFYPESQTKFFATVVPAQLTFVTGVDGFATEVILHQAGREQHWRRTDQASAERAALSLEDRIRSNVPDPRTEAALRRNIQGVMAGEPHYDEMGDDLARATREQLASLQSLLSKWGKLKSVKFIGITDQGDDIYHVRHEYRLFRWTIGLDADGKVSRSWVMSGG